MTTTTPAARRLVCRWLLLAAVMTGVFAMHVLDAGHDSPRAASPSAGHDMSGTADHSAGHDMFSTADHSAGHGTGDAPVDDRDVGAVLIAADTTVDLGSEDGHGPEMAGCILFLVVGGVSLVLALLRRASLPDRGAAAGRAGIRPSDQRRRGPPTHWPREALCVIRV